MEVDTFHTHKYFTVYSGYRARAELFSDSFSAELTQPILDIKQISLEEVTFPNCIVPTAFSQFTWTEDPGYTNNGPVITFPEDFLDPVQIVAYLETQMNLLSPNGYTYSVTLDATTGKISWSTVGGQDFSIYAPVTLDPNASDPVGYYLGIIPLVDERLIYGPTVPAGFSPYANTFTAPYPMFNREWGIAIFIRPFAPLDSSSNDTYLDNAQFVVPLSDSNYGQMIEWKKDNSYPQNIINFKPGHNYKRIFFTISRWVVGRRNRYSKPPFRLNSEIVMRFGYSTYRDTLAMKESLQLEAN